MAFNATFRTGTNEDEITRHNMILFQKLQDDYLGSKRFCDTQIILKNQEKIHVHSFILEAFSDYCRRNRRNVYEFPDIYLYNMKNVLGWMYYANIEIEMDQISADLEVCKRLDISVLYKKIERKVVKLAQQEDTNIIDIINNITASLIIIPFGTSTILPFTDETISKIVECLHKKIKKLTYRDILRLSNYSVITFLSSRITDDKKVDVINLALRWIQERSLSPEQVNSILRHLTFSAMTMEMLFNFRNTLIQTVVPVESGKCVRLRKFEQKVDIVYGKEGDLSSFSIPKMSSSSSFSLSSTNQSSWTLPSLKNDRKEAGLEKKLLPFTDSQFEYINKLSGNDRMNAGIDDCSTAVSFCSEDLLKLGIEIPENMLRLME